MIKQTKKWWNEVQTACKQKENQMKQNELDQNEFDRNKTNCIHIESEREIPAHGDNECNWRLQLPCACTLPSFTNECSYICVYTHGLVELNSGGPSVCQCHVMGCDGMGCDVMGWLWSGHIPHWTQLAMYAHVWWLLNDSNHGGLIQLYWHDSDVSVVVVSVSVCAQAVIAAASIHAAAKHLPLTDPT